jgi:SAM-dependent methyltransferase
MTNESKWAGSFGAEYTERNNPSDNRVYIFHRLLNDLKIQSALEVGSNKGHNLQALANIGIPTLGLEINKEVASKSKILTVVGSAYSLPFCDSTIEMVMTCGVLIHLSDYLKAMQEIYRVSSKYILSIEYFDKEPRKIEYREGVLCQAMPWDTIWTDNFNLKLVKRGNMADFKIFDGTDFSNRCEYVIFEKL